MFSRAHSLLRIIDFRILIYKRALALPLCIANSKLLSILLPYTSGFKVRFSFEFGTPVSYENMSQVEEICKASEITPTIRRRLFLLLLRLRGRCGLLDLSGDFPSVTNNVRTAQGGAAVAARRRHGVEVEDEVNLMDFDVIFAFS
jgi:hypothetical protein